MNINSNLSQNFSSSVSIQSNQTQEINNSNKKSKAADQEKTLKKVECPILPKNLWSFIATFLPLVDLIAFESTSKENIIVSQWTWKYLSRKDRYNFTWQTCEKEKEYKQKWNYCLTKCLFIFSKKSLFVEQGRDNLSEINKLSEKLWEKFPPIHKYIKMRLYELNNTVERQKSLSRIRKEQSEISNSLAYGGESLLYAMYEVRALRYNKEEKDINKMFQCFKHAVDLNVTISVNHVFNWFVGGYFTKTEYDKFTLDLAVEAMKKGDWLEELSKG